MTSHVRLLGVVALLLVVTACAPEGAASPQAAASVNGEEIPISAVEAQYSAVEANPQFSEQLAADEDGGMREEVQAEILTGLIRSELLAQGAEELGVAVTDADVEQHRQDIVEEVGGEEAFDQLVEQQGLSEDEVADQLRDLALQEAVAEELLADAEVSDEEIEAYHEENYGTASARHILVESEEEGEQVLEELEEGADFGELARERSTDPSAQENDGDLGEFQRGDMVPAFSDAVFGAEEGDLVGPVESDFGFHVIEVQELDAGPPVAEVEDEIRAELLAEDRGEAVQAFLQERTAEADVTVNPRFGTWEDTEGRVVPSDPLGEDGSEEGPESEEPEAIEVEPEPADEAEPES